MSMLTKISAGLLISTLSLTAQAAQPSQPGTEGQTPIQEPSKGTVEIENATEVIQVLHVGTESEKKIIELVQARNPDASLQQFIEALSQDLDAVDQKLEELAASKSVGLAPEQLTEYAKTIEAEFAQEVQTLTQAADAEFRVAVIKAIISRHEKAIVLYNQVEQGSPDEAVKAAVVEIRPLAQKHLEAAQQLQTQTTEPSVPTQPSQPSQPAE
ncbi:MAG TPA: DUF4142 domain-containing protein [Oligoflexus sp.]|nr:DUF4142 domain-containing protein [Oligoflexus sp.]HYX33453.1 DUF4142 domain-containing protein [Oligoflexus sp.]